MFTKSPMVPKKYRLESEKRRRSFSPPRKGRPRSQSPISKKSKAKTGSSKRIIASDEKKQSKAVKNSKTKGKHSDENISEKLEARKKKFESAKVAESNFLGVTFLFVSILLSVLLFRLFLGVNFVEIFSDFNFFSVSGDLRY
jgi:hypothetical protein